MASVESEMGFTSKDNSRRHGRFTIIEKTLFFVAICGFLVCVALLSGLGIMVGHHTSCNKTDINTTDKLRKREIAASYVSNDFSNTLMEDDKLSVRNNSCQKVCPLQSCQTQASFFLNNMDLGIDPCDDFYQFACGNFIKNTIIPDYDNRITMLGRTQTKVADELIDEIKAEIKDDELQAFKLLKTYYRNCINLPRIEKEGISPILETLNNMGGWPVLLGDSWKEDGNAWTDIIHKIKDNGFLIYFPAEFDIGIHPRNTTRNIIRISDARTGINEAFFLDGPNNKTLQAYYNYMVDIAVMLGADNDTARREMKQSFDFEVDLFNIQMSIQELVNSTISYNLITVGELIEKYPSVPWLSTLNKLFNPSGITIDKSEVVILYDLKFFTEFEKLISRTPKRVVANFLLWCVVTDAIDYLPGRFLDRQIEYEKVVNGIKERKPRAYSCVKDVMTLFPISLSSLYVRKYFNKEVKEQVIELVKDVKDQFRNILMKVDWMDDETKKFALEKIDVMDVFVGYADELFDDDKINDYYKGLEINNGSYLKSAFNMTFFYTKHYYETLRKLVDKKDWTANKNAVVVNAYYYRHKNTFEIPAGILRGSLFHFERPKYLNYGAIGSIIGHEITHGFDNEGRKNDKHGKQMDWWAEDTKKKYREKAKCFVDQYSNYTIKEIDRKLNGNLSQDENIADNGGFKVAYYAYKEWLRRSGITEPCLPGLNFTGEQMFWISAANNWCSKLKIERLKLVLPNDVHSPPEARVKIPFSNIQEFADDFGCKLGSKMNPVKKCVLW